MPVSERSAYQRGWRRVLVDMEVPAWDERFLSEYDPVAMADLYARAGASSVGFVCKTMIGLCYWPTEVGEMHPGLGGRDVVGETVRELRERGIGACAYYSVVYDNWAFERSPDWRFQRVGGRPRTGSHRDRYGICCPNSAGYRRYVTEQIADLFGRYDFECGFCDMSIWPGVCGCRHCRERYQAEAGAELPETIDWTSPEWCTFQTTRERWIDELQKLVTSAMREAQPSMAVYHNFAFSPRHWAQAPPFGAAEHSDFLGGDVFGDELDQLVVTRLMSNLSRSRPVEYMTFATAGVMDHVTLKSAARLRARVLGAIAESAAFTYIPFIDPLGTTNPGVYDRVAEVFGSVAELEPYLGGEPIEDVAVYLSSDSKMDFSENGRAVGDPLPDFGDYPHLRAARGACRILQRAHIPFGVITRRQLDDLDRYRVVVLPDVARMDAAEVEAIRAYVRRGGRVYGSRYTSLVETRGVRHDDFMLADVFGVYLEAEEGGGEVYARPSTGEIAALIEPQTHLSAKPGSGSLDGGVLRLRAEPDAETLATLSLPYAHPHTGDVFDRRWASLCSKPPWEETQVPLLVRHAFGQGRSVYSSLDVEREESDANEALFAGLVADLLADDWSLRCSTHPSVRMSAFHHADEGTIRVVLLNCPAALALETALRLRAPDGRRFIALEELPGGRAIPFVTAADCVLECTLGQLPELTMLRARYE